jgi:hypothetical protein
MSTKEAERLQELRLLLQCFRDRGLSVVRPLSPEPPAGELKGEIVGGKGEP